MTLNPVLHFFFHSSYSLSLYRATWFSLPLSSSVGVGIRQKGPWYGNLECPIFITMYSRWYDMSTVNDFAMCMCAVNVSRNEVSFNMWGSYGGLVYKCDAVPTDCVFWCSSHIHVKPWCGLHTATKFIQSQITVQFYDGNTRWKCYWQSYTSKGQVRKFNVKRDAKI